MKTGLPLQPRVGRGRRGQRGRQRLRPSLPLPAPSRIRLEGFPGGASAKEFTCQCRRCQRQGSDSLGWEDPPGGGHSNPLQYSCLKKPKDRGAWQATVHRVARVRNHLATKTTNYPGPASFRNPFTFTVSILCALGEG